MHTKCDYLNFNAYNHIIRSYLESIIMICTNNSESMKSKVSNVVVSNNNNHHHNRIEIKKKHHCTFTMPTLANSAPIP
jgi:hypothetical protein